MFNILNYGAKGDGITLNTVAIQSAIDACYKNGGGRVTIPAGKFLTGTIVLKTNVELYLEAGALVLGSTVISDYLDLDDGHKLTLYNTPIIFSYYRRPLIYAESCENISISGTGRIDGQGGFMVNFPNEGDETNSRPILIIMNKVKRLRVSDITLTNPSMWTTRFEYCEDVVIRGVTIRSMRTNNGDGLDFQGGRNICISDCNIEAGDDCISLKMFKKGDEIRNVAITNCVFKSNWCAFRVGAETDADCSEVTMSNCVIDCSSDGIKIHSCGGSTIENMTFSNITMRNVERPFFIVADTYTFDEKGSNCRPIGSVIRNINFSNILSAHKHDDVYDRYVADKIPGSVISGSYSGVVENLSFENIIMQAEGGVSDLALADPVVYEYCDYMDKYAEAREFRRSCVPASGLFVRRVKNCTFKNIKLSSRLPDVRPYVTALRCEDSLFEIISEKSEACARPVLVEKSDSCAFYGTNVHAFSDDEREREEKNDAMFSEVYAKQTLETAFVNEARVMPNGKVLKGNTCNGVTSFAFDLDTIPEKAYVYFAWAKGRADFYCNGKFIGEHKFPIVEGYKNIPTAVKNDPVDGYRWVLTEKCGDYYDREYYCAFDLTEFLTEGKNVIEVKGEDFKTIWNVHYLWK